jgi:hypothetical protein
MKAENYKTIAAMSVAEKTIPPTTRGRLCWAEAPTELFAVEVELDPALELVPVCPAAGEEVVSAVVPLVVAAAPDVETPGGTVPPGQFVGGEAVLDWATWKERCGLANGLYRSPEGGMGKRTHSGCIFSWGIG